MSPTHFMFGASDVLRDIGVLDADATLRATLRRGQPTIEEMVDRYHIRCPPVPAVEWERPRRAPRHNFSELW